MEEGAPEGASIKSSALLPDGAAEAVLPMDATTPPRRNVATGKADEGAGDFVLGALLGKGGMGLVFRAGQTGLDRDVALKTIIPGRSGDAEARRKFFAEARVTGQLDHPNIVPVYELATAPDGSLFYTMKEVRGKPWSKAMPALSETENIDILLKVADAVAFAHGKGVVHRDLKPENVMLGDYGEVLLMDWGLAVGVKDGAKAERLSPSNARGGTPAYMAPEMAAADPEKIGPASDVYLLGAILYEILTRLRPHTGQNVFGCIAQALMNVIQPSDRRDEWMDAARRALADDPAERFRDVKDFQHAVRECREHAASLALSKEARETLAKAKKTGDYTDHARAVFGFGEALRLWPENSLADLGLTMSRKAYAETAVKRGDFDLALSQTEHMPAGDAGDLDRRAEAGKAERERRTHRIKRLTRIVAGLSGLVAVVLLGSAWRMSKSANYARSKQKEAEAALSAKDAAEARSKLLSTQLALTANRLGLFESSEAARIDLLGEAENGVSALTAAAREAAAWPGDARAKAKVLASLSLLAQQEEECAAFVVAFDALGKEAAAAGNRELPGRLRDMADALRARLPTGHPLRIDNLLQNGDFSGGDDIPGWSFQTPGLPAGIEARIAKGVEALPGGGHALFIRIAKSNRAPPNMPGLPVSGRWSQEAPVRAEANEKYHLSFKARGFYDQGQCIVAAVFLKEEDGQKKAIGNFALNVGQALMQGPSFTIPDVLPNPAALDWETYEADLILPAGTSALLVGFTVQCGILEIALADVVLTAAGNSGDNPRRQETLNPAPTGRGGEEILIPAADFSKGGFMSMPGWRFDTRPKPPHMGEIRLEYGVRNWRRQDDQHWTPALYIDIRQDAGQAMFGSTWAAWMPESPIPVKANGRYRLGFKARGFCRQGQAFVSASFMKGEAGQEKVIGRVHLDVVEPGASAAISDAWPDINDLPWQTVEAEFIVPPGTTSLQTPFEFMASSGAAEIADMVLISEDEGNGER